MFKDTPTQETLNKWEHQLRGLVKKLIKGQIALIEFGQPEKNLSDVFTRIRIRKSGEYLQLWFVHVFYGEHASNHVANEPDPVGYPIQIDTAMKVIVNDAMAEVRRWTEERARVGKNYLVNINEGLEFVGHAMDVYAPKADI